jgi:hypothetical protein
MQNKPWTVIVGSTLIATIGVVCGVATNKPSPHALAVSQQTENFGAPSWGNGQTIILDPQSVTSCSGGGSISDNNDCSAVCNAPFVGPCIHGYELENRWHGKSARFNAATVIQWVSAETVGTDPHRWHIETNSGGTFTLKATLPAATLSTTLSGAQVNWGQGGGNVGNWGSFRSSSVVFGQNPGFLFTNTTQAGSPRSWCTTNSIFNGGVPFGRCVSTIPTTPIVPPSTNLTPALWTLSAGGAGSYAAADNITLTQLLTVNLTGLDCTSDTNASGCFIHQLTIFDPSGTPGTNQMDWGPGVTGYDVRIDRVLNVWGNSSRDEGCVNCYVNGGFQGTRYGTAHYWRLVAGGISSTGFVNATGQGFALDGYPMLGTNSNWINGVSMGLVALNGELNLYGYTTLAPLAYVGGIDNGVNIYAPNPGAGVWAGVLEAVNPIGPGTLHYDASHGGITGILTTGTTFMTFLLNSQTTGCSTYVSGGLQVQTCGLLPTAANIDAAPASATQFNGVVLGAGATTDAGVAAVGGSIVGVIP